MVQNESGAWGELPLNVVRGFNQREHHPVHFLQAKISLCLYGNALYSGHIQEEAVRGGRGELDNGGISLEKKKKSWNVCYAALEPTKRG